MEEIEDYKMEFKELIARESRTRMWGHIAVVGIMLLIMIVLIIIWQIRGF